MKSLTGVLRRYQQCDGCNRGHTKRLTSKVSRWCASWFIGDYCKRCYRLTEQAMKILVSQENKEEAQHAL